jgi:hypothetical protein
MRCVICGHAILPAVEPIVSTTTGDFVHVGCADRDARAAYRLRTCRVVISVALSIGLLGLAAYIQVGVIALVTLLMLLAAVHVRLNARWWHLTIVPRRWRWR